jgi:hypothetical protein
MKLCNTDNMRIRDGIMVFKGNPSPKEIRRMIFFKKIKLYGRLMSFKNIPKTKKDKKFFNKLVKIWARDEPRVVGVYEDWRLRNERTE